MWPRDQLEMAVKCNRQVLFFHRTFLSLEVYILCAIKEIEGTTYMFFEWKNGDYVFRGVNPYYYVLKKVE